MDFNILDKSGVSVSVLAEAIGASRHNVYKWVKGESMPRRSATYYDKLEKILSALDKAVATGKLPLVEAEPGERRARRAKLIAKLKAVN